MEFTLTDEQRALKQMAREFALKEFPAFSKESDDKEKFPTDLMKKAGAQGILVRDGRAIFTRPETSPIR